MQLLFKQLIISVMQNLLFCVPKAAVLHGKSVGFALQKSRFRNAKSKLSFSVRIIFIKPRRFLLSTPVRDKFIIQIVLTALIFLHIPAAPLAYSHKSNMP